MMRNLLIACLFCFQTYFCLAQNTHGSNFKIDCKACHTADGWKINLNKLSFNHDSTGFALEGEHKRTDCKACHLNLLFTGTKSTCADCHKNVHGMQVGNDCARCHTAKSWLVDNIPELHEQNGFPLTGAHKILACVDCHKSETNLRWDRVGNECVSCHKEDYDKTTQPNHKLSGFSTECVECHEPISTSWGNSNFHYFYPLTQGHSIKDCKLCHKSADYKVISTDCISCHLNDYNNAVSPNHKAASFSTNCSECHTTAPGWVATDYKQHDALSFPINSGRHKGTWNACTDCHTTPGDYKMFSCITCHEHSNKTKLDKDHDGERDYKYESNACYKCHPKGDN